MQSLLTSILAVFYILLSIGINVSLHFCHDEIKAIHLVQEVDDFDCCEKRTSDCQMNNTPISSCCSHQAFYLKVNDSQASVSKEYFTFHLTFPTIVLEKENKVIISEKPIYLFRSFSPVPIYLMEQRFTLYG